MIWSDFRLFLFQRFSVTSAETCAAALSQLLLYYYYREVIDGNEAVIAYLSYSSSVYLERRMASHLRILCVNDVYKPERFSMLKTLTGLHQGPGETKLGLCANFTHATRERRLISSNSLTKTDKSYRCFYIPNSFPRRLSWRLDICSSS